MITLTKKAVEELKNIMSKENMPFDTTYLRVGVQGGGCSGWSWSLNLDENYNKDKDILEEQDGIKIVVDNRSSLYVDGTTVDWHNDGLTKQGFLCTNPAVKSTCGCGSSFSF